MFGGGGGWGERETVNCTFAIEGLTGPYMNRTNDGHKALSPKTITAAIL